MTFGIRGLQCRTIVFLQAEDVHKSLHCSAELDQGAFLNPISHRRQECLQWKGSHRVYPLASQQDPRRSAWRPKWVPRGHLPSGGLLRWTTKCRLRMFVASEKNVPAGVSKCHDGQGHTTGMRLLTKLRHLLTVSRRRRVSKVGLCGASVFVCPELGRRKWW